MSKLIIADESRARRDAPDTIPPAGAPHPLALLQTAVQRGASIEEITQLTLLYERWEANEARKAYNLAFSKFKAEAVTVLRNKQRESGPLSGTKYAELSSVVAAVTPALSQHGISASWTITKDQPEWIEVTCTLRHALGHAESVAIGGPPDVGGAKSPLQARMATISYLERYSLKAACGVAEQGEDTDGANGKPAGMPEALQAEFSAAIDEAGDAEGLAAVWREIVAECNRLKDRAAYAALKAKVAARGEMLSALNRRGTSISTPRGAE